MLAIRILSTPEPLVFQQALQAFQHFTGLLVDVGGSVAGTSHHVEGAVVDDHIRPALGGPDTGNGCHVCSGTGLTIADQ